MNEYKMNKLLDINKVLTESLQLKEILKNVILAASKLIEISDVLIIYLYDEVTNKLYLAEGKGIDQFALKGISFSPGESIAGKIFMDKQSKLFLSEEEIDYYMQSMNKDNYRHYLAGVYHKKIKSAFGVPIINQDTCYGVVIVDNFDKDGVFTKEDMQIIDRIADQSAIAIGHAKLYQTMKEKNELLLKSISIHSQFYQFIIEGRGIKHVIKLLEQIIPSKVDFSLEIEKKDNIFPIVRGFETLGCLQLDYPIGNFTHIDQTAIEQASLAIGLELIKKNALFEKEIHFRESVFNQLTSSISERDFQQAISFVHWKKEWPVQAVILEGKNVPLWDTEKITDKERFVQSIEEVFRSMQVKPLIFTRAMQLVIIIPNIRKGILQQLIDEIDEKKNPKSIYFGIGRETVIANLMVSYEEALRSIGYAKQHKINQVEYSMLGIERLLYEVEEDTLTLFMKDTLQNLLPIDPIVLATIQTFIATDRNHKKTSEQLHIHPNTLYQRLKKIEKTLNINLDNEKSWINLVIALQIYVGQDNII